jgi:hypothetical protein
MKLPAVPNPQKYAGLYIYDFGTHTAIGYTAAEIRILRESAAFRNGTAYEIYRVSAGGAFELRGATDSRLTAREAVCFLRRHEAGARKDFDALRRTAEASPVPCAVQMQLATVKDFEPPHVTALLYAVAASAALSGWLEGCGLHAGDQVIGGTDVHHTFLAAEARRIDTCQLTALLDYEDRPADEVLQTTDQAVQR